MTAIFVLSLLFFFQQCFHAFGAPRNYTIDDGEMPMYGWTKLSYASCQTECQGIVPVPGLDNAFAHTWSTSNAHLGVFSELRLTFSGTAIYLFFYQLSDEFAYNVQLDSQELRQVAERNAPNGTLRTFAETGLGGGSHTVRVRPLTSTFVFDYAIVTSDDISEPSFVFPSSFGLTTSETPFLTPSSLSPSSTTPTFISTTGPPSTSASAALPIETTVYIDGPPPSTFPTGAAVAVAIGATLVVVHIAILLFIFLKNRRRKAMQEDRAQHINEFPNSWATAENAGAFSEYGDALVSPISITEKAAQEVGHHQTHRVMQSEIDTLRLQVHLLRQEVSQPNSPMHVSHDSGMSNALSYASTSPSTGPYTGDAGVFTFPLPPVPSTPPPVYSAHPVGAFLSRISRRLTTVFVGNPTDDQAPA